MKNGTHEDEKPSLPEQERSPLWNWTPSSGEGSQAALTKLKRAERVKSSWRRLRSGSIKLPEADGSPSAK